MTAALQHHHVAHRRYPTVAFFSQSPTGIPYVGNATFVYWEKCWGTSEYLIRGLIHRSMCRKSLRQHGLLKFRNIDLLGTLRCLSNLDTSCDGLGTTPNHLCVPPRLAPLTRASQLSPASSAVGPQRVSGFLFVPGVREGSSFPWEHHCEGPPSRPLKSTDRFRSERTELSRQSIEGSVSRIWRWSPGQKKLNPILHISPVTTRERAEDGSRTTLSRRPKLSASSSRKSCAGSHKDSFT